MFWFLFLTVAFRPSATLQITLWATDVFPLGGSCLVADLWCDLSYLDPLEKEGSENPLKLQVSDDLFLRKAWSNPGCLGSSAVPEVCAELITMLLQTKRKGWREPAANAAWNWQRVSLVGVCLVLFQWGLLQFML